MRYIRTLRHFGPEKLQRVAGMGSLCDAVRARAVVTQLRSGMGDVPGTFYLGAIVSSVVCSAVATTMVSRGAVSVIWRAAGGIAERWVLCSGWWFCTLLAT